MKLVRNVRRWWRSPLMVALCLLPTLVWAQAPREVSLEDAVAAWQHLGVRVIREPDGWTYIDCKDAILIATTDGRTRDLALALESIASVLNRQLEPVRRQLEDEATRWGVTGAADLTAAYTDLTLRNIHLFKPVEKEIRGALASYGFPVEGPVVHAKDAASCTEGRCDCAPCEQPTDGRVKTCTCKKAVLVNGVLDHCNPERWDCNSETVRGVNAGSRFGYGVN